MKICVINPGVVHAVPRTLSLRSSFEEMVYVDMKGADDRRLLEDHGIAYHRFEAGGYRLPSIALQGLLRRISPSGIICHFASGPHLFHSLVYNKCPVAIIAMGQDVLYESGDARVGEMLRFMRRMALRRADFVSAKSNYLAARIAEYGRTKPTEVNYWGMDLTVFRPGESARSRDRLGLPQGVPIVLSARAVEPRLNITLIVEAFAGILRDHPDAMLVILGRSRDDYRREVMTRIADAGITDRVRMCGELDRDSLIAYYHASDIVVSMARSEGFPNTVLEAMACEKPVIVGRIPQVTELLRDGYNARICAISPTGVREALTGLLVDPARCIQFGRNARNTVSEVADITRNGTRFAEAFGGIIEAQKTRRRSAVTAMPFSLAYLGYLVLSRLSRLRSH